ncbi:formate dehydrogenase accessory sulfurtransferase FdhD [Lederbergia wuyishanensis]|uniref:Sulfur carrier protein FdhD n=1 Tax=Lederbergia wuyishanensis TaxID=1347903 RepID=A0ABU0CZ96_9BACI|nr:formate dehydrogenase accessory sulfurtransferase FdhD [Lederbergia wuyishanensis]MCJ8006103.1 formate dehydrogenase accessory sulfurtransferase FdhD [Lederbergia wuyishanensis]MDQ0341472.1 FdhD protein [Lederbergia wuyishanensis]
MSNQIKGELNILKYEGNDLLETIDIAAVEYPLTIYLEDEEFATIVCSPTNIKELVIGFLASEGLIRNVDQISSIDIDEHRGYAYVYLKIKQSINKEFFSKRMIGSCCGKSRQFYFYNDANTAKTIMSRHTISINECFSLMKQLQECSIDFQQTGGVHNAALCTNDNILFSYSDIGRHNALDKLYGHVLQHNITVKDKVIVFSGRISSEVILKISKIGGGILISKSAPTTLGIELAKDLGITVIGFVRKEKLNIYSHPERIIDAMHLPHLEMKT